MATARGNLIRKRGKDVVGIDEGTLTVSGEGLHWDGRESFDLRWDQMTTAGSSKGGRELFSITRANNAYVFQCHARTERKAFVKEALGLSPF